jgi:6-phosphogluconolactonase
MKKLFPLLLCWLIMPAAFAGNVLTMIVGTYTDSGSHGIYSMQFNQKTGETVVLDSLKMSNPSFLTISDDARHIYAVNENGGTDAALSAIRLTPSTGHMELINSLRTFGADPCFVETDGSVALTANYTGGSMTVFPINSDGSLGEKLYLFSGTTGGKHPRQATPHVHTARFFDKNTVIATDFSADRLLRFRVDGTKVTEDGTAGFTLPSSGPRHLEFSNGNKFVYAISELAGTVTVFRNTGEELERIQTIASDSLGGRGCADIHLSPDGRFLYASNRLKADGISIFKVERNKGTLQKVGYVLTGEHPRNFAITPNGRFLLCACRDSNVIQVFAVDGKSGMLTDTHRNILLKKPVCVRFSTRIR